MKNHPDLYTEIVHLSFFVGWPTKPNFEKIRRHLAVAQSIFAVEDGMVVGLITALTDKTMFAFIPLIEVIPDFQRKGIGSVLVKGMEAQLAEIYGIDLICDSDMVPFYHELGFSLWTAMIKRNPAAL